MDTRPTTIFCDIDGTLVQHKPLTHNAVPGTKLEVLPDTIAKLSEWEAKGYNIILVTGRKESMRATTEQQLVEAGIFYDRLIMGIGGGQRILINDRKPDGSEYASAININRNEGIGNLSI